MTSVDAELQFKVNQLRRDTAELDHQRNRLTKEEKLVILEIEKWQSVYEDLEAQVAERTASESKCEKLYLHLESKVKKLKEDISELIHEVEL